MTPAAEKDPVLAWVRRLNQMAVRMDEAAQSMHPSAWPEALAQDREAYAALAARGPK